MPSGSSKARVGLVVLAAVIPLIAAGTWYGATWWAPKADFACNATPWGPNGGSQAPSTYRCLVHL